jgi:hypothetical protein
VTIPLRLSFVAIVPLAAASLAHAGLYPAYPLGTGPGVWEVDRHAPAVFSNAGTSNGRSNVLDLGLNPADHFDPTVNNFANTQGRGIQIADASGYSVLYGSVYPQASWSASAGPATNRRTELWGLLAPATGSDTCPASACNLFPILGFSNASPTDPVNAGGTGRFRVFDPYVGFVDLAATVNYDQWNDLCMAWDTPVMHFYVNGVEVYSTATVDPGPPYGPPTHWGRQIQQAYNWGTAYDAQWSTLGTGIATAANVTGGAGQTTPPATPFPTPVTVTVTDASGAPLPCVPVTFTAPASGASGTPSSGVVVTNGSGRATVNVTANGTQGSYAITASVPGGVAPASIPLMNGFPGPASAAAIPALGAPALAALALLVALLAGWLPKRRGR